MTLTHKLNRMQKGVVDKAIDLLDEDGKCLVIMPTGTGKTMVGCKIIEAQKDKKVLWLTQTDELIQQTKKDIMAFNRSVSLFQDRKKNLDGDVVVASVQTISKKTHLQNIDPKMFDLLIIDEAHHAPSSTWRAVADHFQCNRLGLTATPYRNDDLSIEEMFGSSAFTLTYKDAQDENLIAKEFYRVILTNSQLNGVTSRSMQYKPEDLDRLVISKNRNEIIVDSYLKYGRDFMKKRNLPFKAICFCITQAHAIRMKELFLKRGIRAETLLGISGTRSKTANLSNYELKKNRNIVFKSFLNGEIEIICAVNVLNEGKNIPDVGCLLLARPTRSRIIFQQQIGRGCRRIEDKKEEFLVLDYVDMMNKKYPPMSMSKVLNKQYGYNEIILDYFRGKDPLLVDKYIEYLSPDFHYTSESSWNKVKVSEKLLDFYKKNGAIKTLDLSPATTGLPARTTIKRFWEDVDHCFKDLGIPYRPAKSWPKEECLRLVKEFRERNGKIVITDLGHKNNLPSQNQIYAHWGTWTNFLKAVGMPLNKKPNGTWSEKNRNRKPRVYNEFPGVRKHSKNRWRADFRWKGKKYYIGSFKTQLSAREAWLQKTKELRSST